MSKTCWKRWLVAVACTCSGLGFCGNIVCADDLRDAAPPDAYLTAYGMHNPERDYEKQHYQAVWKEIETTKIAEKILQVVESRMGEGDAEQFLAVRDAFRTALEPIEWDKLLNCSESLYVQRMEAPTSVHVLMVRVPEGGAESLKTAIVNLFDLAAGASSGQIPVVTETFAGVEMKTLQLPGEAATMFQPSVGVRGDVVVLTTSLAFAQEALELLANPSASSKFDDPRVVEALTHLPKAEDSLFVFDGKLMAEQMQSIPEYIQRASNGNPEAQRVADLFSDAMRQFDAFDLEVTVEYTEGFRNRKASFGRLSETADKTVLGQMLTKQQLFEDWTQLVPSSTTGFSMTDGVTMLPLYNWLMEMIPAKFPEAQLGLDQFATIQDQLDVHLKEDILEAFSGEMVSITTPGAPTMLGKGSQSVTMLRCSKPDRIQELMHRGMNALNENPQARSMGIRLEEAAGLEGFEEIKAQNLAMTGLRPVIGFHDGWMVMGSHPPAVETALATQAGDNDRWADSDRFKEFGITIDGAVESISYSNTGESIRAMAQLMQQAGAFAPMLIGLMQSQNQGQGGPDLQVVQEIAGLLPSMGRILSKLDFIDATISVCQPGAEAGTYMRQSVTLIRPPKEEKPASPAASPKREDGASKSPGK